MSNPFAAWDALSADLQIQMQEAADKMSAAGMDAETIEAVLNEALIEGLETAGRLAAEDMINGTPRETPIGLLDSLTN